MPRTAIAVTDQPFQGSSQVPSAAADAANGMMFPNDGRTLLIVRNDSGGGVQVTVDSVEDFAGREGDEVRTIAAGEVGVFGPFRPGWWNQKSGADLGQLYVDFDVDTSIEVAALRLHY